jgi:hypothetical protein
VICKSAPAACRGQCSGEKGTSGASITAFGEHHIDELAVLIVDIGMTWHGTPRSPAAAAVRGSARGEEDVAVEAEEVVGSEAA